MCGYTVEDKRSEGKLIIHGSGHTNDFYLFGGRDERSQDIIQGITLAGCLLDEVALMPESFAQQATLRCSVDGARQWYNCNPAGSPTHWFKSKWIDQYKRNNFLYLHFTMEDNLSLSPEVRARYERQYVGMYYRRYIEGRWVSAEGVIYDMWDNNENVYTEAEAEENYQYRYPRYIGVDYGTTNPMVFLDCIDTGEKLLIKNEYYYDCKRTVDRKQKTNTEYADDFEEFVQHDHGVTVIIDPSAESFALELRNRGYRVKKADNEVLDGIRKTAAMIKARRIQVLKDKTPNFLREVESYVWDEKATLRGEEKPLKVNDHCLTGDTIVNTPDGDFAISELVGTSGKVYSFDGKRKIIADYYNVRQTGVEDIFEIELEDGRTIKCSAEHPILTKRGWVLACELTEQDEITEADETVRYIVVKSIRKRQAEPVYNMEVSGTHCFAVNGGLIVHNCMDATRYLINELITRRRMTLV